MIWRWIAWNKGRERICDCGVARADSETVARAIAWQCIGGPHMAAIVEVEVVAVADERIAELKAALAQACDLTDERILNPRSPTGQPITWSGTITVDSGKPYRDKAKLAELRKLVTP